MSMRGLAGTPVARASNLDDRGLTVRARKGWAVLPVLALVSLIACQPAIGAELRRTLTAEAAELFQWVERTRDNGQLPFMIIDKRRTHLWVFDRSGNLQGDTPILLGSARGDHSVPGIGDKKLSEIKPQERTTPAGRFVAEVGMNARGEDVVWVDYDGAVSIHRVLTTNPRERRVQRLATPTSDDNRVSYGCINVPTAFFENVVRMVVRGGNSIVYVMPDSRPLRSVFNQLAVAHLKSPDLQR